MINFDGVTREKIKNDNLNLSQLLYHPYRILILKGFGSEKKALINLRSKQEKYDDDIIDKIFLYVRDPYEPKYQIIISKRESIVLKQVFVEYSSVKNEY